MFFRDFRDFVLKEKYIVLLYIFVSVVVYGYFVSNWSISTDCDWFTFLPKDEVVKFFLVIGRFVSAFLRGMNISLVIPFWNDIWAIIFLIIACLTYSMIFYKSSNVEIQINRRNTLIFGMVYLISPIYVFFLRFTTYDMDVALGFLLVGLSVYYTQLFFIKKLKNAILFATLFLYLANGIYQVYIIYYFISILILLLISGEYKKNIMYSLLIMVLALSLYFITWKVSNIILHGNPGIYGYFAWNLQNPEASIVFVKDYIYNVMFNYDFNFFFKVTLVVLVVFSVLNFHVKNLVFLLILWFILVAPFGLPIVMGNAMPLRTMVDIPLSLAGIWLVMYIKSSKNIKLLLSIIVVISSYYNGHYITRMFYSDNMERKYEANLMRDINQFIINHTGDAYMYKPILILGNYGIIHQPFSFKEMYDTFGFSINQLLTGDSEYWRLNVFMRYLGYDYIVPTESQIEYGKLVSYDMPNYPANGSIKQLDNMVILKLSSEISIHQPPVLFDINKYKKVSDFVLNLDEVSVSGGFISYGGSGFFNKYNNLGTRYFIRFRSDKHNYVFPCGNQLRMDLGQYYMNSSIQYLDNAGITGKISVNYLANGTYTVGLLMLNNGKLAIRNTNATITVKH